jgi:RHS repeat-associated protein
LVDTQHRLRHCRISVKSNGSEPIDCTSATVGNVLDFTYNFNAGTANNGNVSAITNNRAAGRSQSFTYDELNRLKSAYTQTTSGADCWGLEFGYDIWANLLSASKKSTHTACSPPTLSVGVSGKNQLNDSGFAYDAAGNLTNTPNPGGLAITYDAENRMTSAAGVTYTYDGDGKRVAKSSGKLYWFGMSSDPLFETDAAGNVTDEFIFFAGKRTARRKSPSGEIHYYFADHLGSSRVVTSAAGAILDDSDFYPFGKEVPLLAASDNNYLFTGKERDSETGLDFFIARYYSSQYGRFLSPDEFTGGPVDAFSSNDPAPPATLPYADITNPQSLNKYTYTYNNPVKYVDPNGHEGGLSYVQAPDGTWTVRAPDIDLNRAVRVLNTHGLDAAGFAPPPVGPVADGLNAALSAKEGKFWDAALNLVAMIPIIGDAAKAAKLRRAQELGREGIQLAGVVQNTERIVSLTGTAAFRIPDELDKGAKIIGEVKNVTGKVSLTNQIKDFVEFAGKNPGFSFTLRVPKGTKFTKPLQKAIEDGKIAVEYFSK